MNTQKHSKPKRMKKAITTAAITAAAALGISSAHAANYTYLEGGFVEIEDETGARIAGSADINHRLHVFGEFADAGPFSIFTAGLGLHRDLEPGLDLNAGISLESVDAGRADDVGIGLRAGVRWDVANRLELNPGIRYVNVFDDSAVSFRVAGLYAATPKVDLQLAAQGGDDDRIEAGARINF